jgi:hypothetical protein
MKKIFTIIAVVVAAATTIGCGGKEDDGNYLTSIDAVKQGIKGEWQDIGKIYATTFIFLDSTCVWIRVTFDGDLVVKDTSKYRVIERSGGYSIEQNSKTPVYAGNTIEYYRDVTSYLDIRKLTEKEYEFFNGYEIMKYYRKR